LAPPIKYATAPVALSAVDARKCHIKFPFKNPPSELFDHLLLAMSDVNITEHFTSVDKLLGGCVFLDNDFKMK